MPCPMLVMNGSDVSTVRSPQKVVSSEERNIL
jgi:hypothetical protein